MKKIGAGLIGRRQIQWVTMTGRIAWDRDQIGLWSGLLLLIIIISVLSPSFRQVNNFMLILLDVAAIGIVAAGQTMVVLTGGIDLSVGSVVALTGIVAALVMRQEGGMLSLLNPYLAVGVGLGTGTLIGLGHGYLIAKRNMPPFIVTLVSMGVLRGVSLVITEGQTIHSLPDAFKWISDAYLVGVPLPGLIMISVFLILSYVLRNTKMGRYTYAIGGNEVSARLSGVPVDRYKIYTYMLSGFMAALAGMIVIARIDGAVYTNGEGYEINSVAAVIIGGTSLQGGIGGLLGTFVGVLIMAVVRNGLVMLNISYQWHGIVIGSIILLAVFFDQERRRARQAAPRPRTTQALTESTYLEGMVGHLTQLISHHFGSPYVRVYLLDPRQDELVECRANSQLAARTGSIAHQATTTGQAIILNNLPAGHNSKTEPLTGAIQSAAAIPLMLREQLVGVLEVQSQNSYGFGPETVKRLTDLVQDEIAPLHNAWLLECGWLAEQTRNALRHLWDDVYLGQCALGEWVFPGLNFAPEGGPVARGARLRQLLLDTMDNLKPDKDAANARPTDRRYDILHLTYVEECIVDEVIKELAVSRRQYFYDLKDAVGALAHQLVRTHPKISSAAL